MERYTKEIFMFVFRCWKWAQVTWRVTCSRFTCCWPIVTSIYLGRVKTCSGFYSCIRFWKCSLQLLVCTHIDIRVCNICQTYLCWSCVAGAADKPYNVEDAVSYNELDYLSVSFITRPDYFFMIILRFKCFSVFVLPASIPHFVINKIESLLD